MFESCKTYKSKVIDFISEAERMWNKFDAWQWGNRFFFLPIIGWSKMRLVDRNLRNPNCWEDRTLPRRLHRIFSSPGSIVSQGEKLSFSQQLVNFCTAEEREETAEADSWKFWSFLKEGKERVRNGLNVLRTGSVPPTPQVQPSKNIRKESDRTFFGNQYNTLWPYSLNTIYSFPCLTTPVQYLDR